MGAALPGHAAIGAAAPAALLGLGAARCEDTMQVPRTKKTPKELPEYFVPKVPYPAWDSDWDGRRRARCVRAR